MPWQLPAYIAAFLVGLLLLERGADLFTGSVGRLAKRTGASETVVGLLTAGMEWEELIVVSLAAATGHLGIAVGNLIGSNIANIAGSFALGPLARPIQIVRDDRIYALVMLAITGGATLVMTGGQVSRLMGITLLVVFAAYIGLLLYALRQGVLRKSFEREVGDDHERSSLRRDLAITAAGLLLVLVGALAVVQAGIFFAQALGVSEFVVGLTLVAIGTTLPDKAISLVGALKGRSGVVTANAVGSNIFNLTFALGLAAVIAPLPVDEATISFDLPVMVGVSALLVLFFLRRQVGRLEALTLLLIYAGYLTYNFTLK